MNKYSITDIVTQSFLNIDFPAQYVATMKTTGLENVGITDFYNAFCKKNGVSGCGDTNVVFTPATILGHLYITFLLPQQSLFNSLSENEIDTIAWGISITKGKDKTMKDIARRMRNALAHNHFSVSKSMEFTFWDAKPPANSIQDAEIIYKFTFDGLMFKFLAEWQKVIMPGLTGQQG